MDKESYSEKVAKEIIKQLQEGTSIFQKPWVDGVNANFPKNAISGASYRGINRIHLLSASVTEGFQDNRWLTFKQAKELGGQVRKGEHGRTVEYWKFTETVFKKDENGKNILDKEGLPIKITQKLERPKVFYATVFNGDQIDNLPEQTISDKIEAKWEDIEKAEKILQNSGANLVHDNPDKAYYSPSRDLINVPDKAAFKEAAGYYSTALHELGHWTGHKDRLNRDLSNPFGSEGYAREELRAEISSMILGDELGIGFDPGNHIAYVDSWIKVLQEDPREIFRAAADAEKIQKYILDLSLEQKQEQEQENHLENISAQTVQAGEMSKENVEKTYLDVPFSEKEAAKELGARWDRKNQSWYIKGDVPAEAAKWLPEKATNEQMPKEEEKPLIVKEAKENVEKTYLAVPFSENEAAKELGARWDRKNQSWYIKGDVPAEAAKWLPENATNEQMPALRPEEEFANAMRANGLITGNGHPIMDGQKHRVACEGDKRGEKSGFYVGHLDGHPAGFIANNRTSQEQKWRATGVQISEEEKAKLSAVAAQKMAARQEEAKKLAAKVSQSVKTEKEELQAQSLDNKQSPYLINKGIEGKKDVFAMKDGGTYIPLYNTKGEVTTAQTINENGMKTFTTNGVKTGSFHVVDGMDNLFKGDTIVIAEGYATAATLQETIKDRAAVVAAFDCHNLGKVGEELRNQFPEKRIIFAADNDEATMLTSGRNPGLDAATKAAAKVGGEVIKPNFVEHNELVKEIKDKITPEKWKLHCQAKTALENGKLTEQQKESANKSLIDEKVIEKYNILKSNTDFNDLSKKENGKKQIAAQTNFLLAGKKVEKEKKKEQEIVKKYEHKKNQKKSIGIH